MLQNGCDREVTCMNLSKGKKDMGQFDIGIHNYASDLSLSKPFWGILATPVYRRSVFMLGIL